MDAMKELCNMVAPLLPGIGGVAMCRAFSSDIVLPSGKGRTAQIGYQSQSVLPSYTSYLPLKTHGNHCALVTRRHARCFNSYMDMGKTCRTLGQLFVFFNFFLSYFFFSLDEVRQMKFGMSHNIGSVLLTGF